MKRFLVLGQAMLLSVSLAIGKDDPGPRGLAKAASQADEEWCEKQWITDSAAHLSGPTANGSAMLKRWLSHGPRCGTTYAYFGRLATIQVLMKDFAAAKATLAKAPTAESPFAYSLDAARIQLAVEERLDDSIPITANDLSKFESSYASLVKKYPNWPTGYALLGGVQTLLGKHIDAIENLKRASKTDAYELYGVYRNLTISYSATGTYQAALVAADKAYELNSALTSDPAFVFAAATANSALGQFEEAEALLRLILSKRPEVREDPEFARTVEFYKQQRSRRTTK